VLCVLVFGFAFADKLTYWGEHGLFGDEIVFATTTPYQRLVITRWKDDLRLYINGNLQFSSRDEYRYHEALVHPVLQPLPWAKRVLVLGGGDGWRCAKSCVIQYRTRHAGRPRSGHDGRFHAARRTGQAQSRLVQRQARARGQCRCGDLAATARRYVRRRDRRFPDPSSFALGKLYSVPFYGMVKKHLAANGLMVVQSTSPFFAPHAYWTIDATLREVGMKTYPYHAYALVRRMGLIRDAAGDTAANQLPPADALPECRHHARDVQLPARYAAPADGAESPEHPVARA
jgi:spermidine synthase